MKALPGSRQKGINVADGVRAAANDLREQSTTCGRAKSHGRMARDNNIGSCLHLLRSGILDGREPSRRTGHDRTSVPNTVTSQRYLRRRCVSCFNRRLPQKHLLHSQSLMLHLHRNELSTEPLVLTTEFFIERHNASIVTRGKVTLHKHVVRQHVVDLIPRTSSTCVIRQTS